MKRILTTLVLAITMICVATLPALATEPELLPTPTSVTEASDGTTTVFYDDGSTLTISPVYVTSEQSLARAAAKTVSGGKDATYKDSDGNLEWKYTLSGTFSYVPGVSSTCTSATYKNNIYDDSWSFSDGSATKSGNKAIGKGTYVKKFLFITTKTCNVDISITCDTYGNLS